MPFVAPTVVRRVVQNVTTETPDLLAVEEPLEIRLGYGPAQDRQQRSLVVTMRTPGVDAELATGFLYAENIIQQPADVLSCRHCVQDAEKEGNVIRVELRPGLAVDWQRLERITVSSASCGLCGKTTIEAAMAHTNGPLMADFSVDSAIVHNLPDRVRQLQTAFAHTGGIHAAALFDADGTIRLVREDIGRHNALDKLIGAAFWKGWLPLSDCGIFLSGRIGVELVQKSWRAGVPLLAAVGAPSSLAVQMAREARMTLVGFVRDDRFNIYTEPDRLITQASAPATPPAAHGH
ncbi:formate dehydrogenase accessory sulfurtransferase FdhD [Spirosoma montaniterrae]|uniref:Sulfur carrier protein FdhD n=1 Tax=Spirosoma montaniterrae TaxID=1178516 RepID=A0A1P9WYH7_9BACT|nr:formate dehydrogenase accessory sulfurtransferase FdhD [Spirosoma montaniterrae]AQG80430.1 formate dehydrogenase accessory protein FdhD [Spirosoma montaniterrae]